MNAFTQKPDLSKFIATERGREQRKKAAAENIAKGGPNFHQATAASRKAMMKAPPAKK